MGIMFKKQRKSCRTGAIEVTNVGVTKTEKTKEKHNKNKYIVICKSQNNSHPDRINLFFDVFKKGRGGCLDDFDPFEDTSSKF